MDDFLSFMREKYGSEFLEDEIRSDPVMMTLYAAFYAGKRVATKSAVDWLLENHGLAEGRHNYYANAAQHIKHLYRK